MIIGTYNSGTGEKGRSFISNLVSIFFKTQTKSIKEQYRFGCRVFDLHVDKVGNDWVCSSGLWKSKKTLEEIIAEIDSFLDPCYVTIICKDGYKDIRSFLDLMKSLKEKYGHLRFGSCYFGSIKVINEERKRWKIDYPERPSISGILWKRIKSFFIKNNNVEYKLFL